jgi:hypothetical protein
VSDDVITIFGNCEATPCKRKDVKITEQDDLTTVRDKQYHKDCVPTTEELAARDMS